MTERRLTMLRWTMRVVGVGLIAFVVLMAVYARLAAPPVGAGVRIAADDTGDRYLASDVQAASCVFAAEDGPDQTIRTEPRARSFLKGVAFTPSSGGGVLTCDQDIRVATGLMASLSQVAEREFLVAFPGVLLVAGAQVVRPRREPKPRRI